MNARTTIPAAAATAVLLLAGCAATGGAASDSGYMPGSGYHLIMAEIAAQRGVEATAAQEYLNSAERSDDPAVSQHATEYAFEYGFDAWALRAARRWAQLAPDDTSAGTYLTRLLVRRNDVAGATAALERALGPAATRSDADYEGLSEELGAEGNSEAVTRVLSRIAAHAPESTGLDMALATAALRSGDFDLAIESARKAAARPRTSAAADAADGQVTDYAEEADALIGRALLSRGDTDAALEFMARRVEAKPSLNLMLEQARLLAAADRLSDALSQIDEAERRFGAEPEVRRLRARVAFDTGDMQAAWEGYGGLLKEGVDEDESCFYLAQIAMKQQRFDQALQLLARVQEPPYLLPAEDAMARIAEAAGDTQSALQLLDTFAKRRPELAFDLARYRAALLQRQGRDQEALAVFTNTLNYRPDDVDTLLARGALFEKMNSVDAAVADMEKAVALMPDNAVALNALGYTLANRTRRYADAYRLIRRALERQPDSAAITDSYGWVLYRQGRLPEARSFLQLANSELPDPEVAAHLGEVMWKQGDQDAARQLWADALEKDPESQPLRETMARFVK